MKPHHPREQVREKLLDTAQEEAGTFDAPQLLQEYERDDIRV